MSSGLAERELEGSEGAILALRLMVGVVTVSSPGRRDLSRNREVSPRPGLVSAHLGLHWLGDPRVDDQLGCWLTGYPAHIIGDGV